MKRIIAAAMAVLWVWAGTLAAAQTRWISEENKARFATLLTALVNAYESPSAGDDARIDEEATFEMVDITPMPPARINS